MIRAILAALALASALPATARPVSPVILFNGEKLDNYKPPYKFPEPEYSNYFKLNGLCRGGRKGMTAEENTKICKRRDSAGAALEALGWCYGPDRFSDAEMRWYPCEEEAKQQPFDCRKIGNL